MAAKQQAPVQYGNIPGLGVCRGRDTQWSACEALGGTLGRCCSYVTVHMRLCKSVDIPRKKWLFRRVRRWECEALDKAAAVMNNAQWFYPMDPPQQPWYAGTLRGQYALTGQPSGRTRLG